MPEIAPDFVYVTYIGASPDIVWNALIDRDLTRAYWDHYNVSDWKKGSRWEHVRTDAGGKVDLIGTVVEIDPPRRLVITWGSPDAEEARRSKVVFEIAPVGAEAKLTVTHSELEVGSEMLSGITRGWPQVLSNLKTLLETGKPLPTKPWATAETA